MGEKPCRLHFDQIGFHVFNDSISNIIGQQIYDSGMKLGRCRKRPAFDSINLHHLCNLLCQLPVNATIGFVFKVGFGDRPAML